eukprot:6187189-Pleurochrysis_carterae.AAC.4
MRRISPSNTALPVAYTMATHLGSIVACPRVTVAGRFAVVIHGWRSSCTCRLVRVHNRLRLARPRVLIYNTDARWRIGRCVTQ